VSTDRARRRVRCLACDASVTLNNLRSHYFYRHGSRRPGVALGDLYDELEVAAPRAEIVRAQAEEAPESYRRAAAASEPPPLELDDIVLAVVDSLAEPSGLLPVSHLPAVFAWREATAMFLRSVRPGSTERPLDAP
jgi:hypothetical protein